MPKMWSASEALPRPKAGVQKKLLKHPKSIEIYFNLEVLSLSLDKRGLDIQV